MTRQNIWILFVTIFTLMAMISCKNKNALREDSDNEITFDGYYVTDSYFNRNERYDWVGVSVKMKNDTTADIAIRSRSDIKKPTCTFDAVAVVIDQATLQSTFENKFINFTFSKSYLQISSGSDGILSYFCSGGGSLAGTYQKLDEMIDMAQLYYLDFEKDLSLQGISFNVQCFNHAFSRELIIQPSNLEIDNQPVNHVITGFVTGADAEDLNSDGSPELLVYIRSMQDGMFGDVIGYSVNNGKSMSQIYFQPTRENPALSEGYFGYDEFTTIETKLAQRFPVFEIENGKLNQTGKMRQISYTLEDGEASRYFKTDQVSEY